MDKFGRFALRYIVLLPLSVWTSVSVLCALWNWFAVPIGLSAITMGEAWGLGTLLSFLWLRNWVYYPSLVQERMEMDWAKKTWEYVVRIVVAWLMCLVGWAIHQWAL